MDSKAHFTDENLEEFGELCDSVLRIYHFIYSFKLQTHEIFPMTSDDHTTYDAHSILAPHSVPVHVLATCTMVKISIALTTVLSN